MREHDKEVRNVLGQRHVAFTVGGCPSFDVAEAFPDRGIREHVPRPVDGREKVIDGVSVETRTDRDRYHLASVIHGQ